MVTMGLKYIVICFFLFQIQFLNMAIPGRFTHLLMFVFVSMLILVSELKYHPSKHLKKCLLLTLLFLGYGALITSFSFFRAYISQVEGFSLGNVMISLTYLSFFCVIPLSISSVFSRTDNSKIIKLILLFHLITVITGLLQILGLFPNNTILNANDIYVHSRISILDKEPSVSTFRLVFLIWGIVYLFSLCKLTFYKKIILASYVFFLLLIIGFVRSKFIIFIIPLAVIIAAVHMLFIAKKIKIMKAIFFSGIAVISFIGILQSNYFYYAYTYTLMQSEGSFSTRMIMAIEGANVFIHNPLGVGMGYPLYLLDFLKSSSLLNYFYNQEIAGYLALTEYNTIISPKSFFITSSLILGVTFFYLVVKCFFWVLHSSRGTSSLFPNLFFFWFSFLYVLISDFNLQPLIYFTIYILLIKNNPNRTVIIKS
jgi:hypothetical protein